MVFSNPWYFVFLAVTLALLAPPLSVPTKKKLLAACSCFFYAAWDWHYLGLLLFISVVDYACAAGIARNRGKPEQKAWLVASITSNLSVLAYFKYTNFFIDNLNGLLPLHVPHQDILLPAGISFYTFKTMSYVIDVYRGELAPVRTLWDYVTFITFFPELIAGPIVRGSVLLPQMDREIGPSYARLATGMSLFLLGFTKKILADRLALMVDPVFANPGAFDTVTLWAGLLAYSLQIFCDFAGYSDMAIGTAKAIGYDLPQNFHMPYLSANITEFWRRWHMTLSFWLRDYLYIPLGGNRHGVARTYVNLTLTMLLGGLWHGASWNFVIWGALHGLALALHRATREVLGERALLPRFVAIPATFTFATLCWVFFRAPTFAATAEFFHGMFLPRAGVTWIAPDLALIAGIVVLGHALGVLVDDHVAGQGSSLLDRPLKWLGAEIQHDRISGSYLVFGREWTGPGTYVIATWVTLAALLALTDTNPFIYFQF